MLSFGNESSFVFLLVYLLSKGKHAGKGGVELSDDTFTGHMGGVQFFDWFCSIISNGSLTTGGQIMSVVMPGEV